MGVCDGLLEELRGMHVSACISCMHEIEIGDEVVLRDGAGLINGELFELPSGQNATVVQLVMNNTHTKAYVVKLTDGRCAVVARMHLDTSQVVQKSMKHQAMELPTRSRKGVETTKRQFSSWRFWRRS